MIYQHLLWTIMGVVPLELGLRRITPEPRLNQTCPDLALADYCQDICVQRLGLCFQECSTNDVSCMSHCARNGCFIF